MVINRIADASDGSKLQTVRFCQPLMARFLITAIHTIVIIGEDICLQGLSQLTCPVKAVERSHFVLLYLLIRKDVQDQFFSERSLILKVKL